MVPAATAAPLRRDVFAFPSDRRSTLASLKPSASDLTCLLSSTCTCGASISRPKRKGFQTQSSSGCSVFTPCLPTRCTNLIGESLNPGVLSVAKTLWLPHQSWFATSFCICSMSGSCAPAPLRVKILQSPSICVSPQVTTFRRVWCWLTSSAV